MISALKYQSKNQRTTALLVVSLLLLSCGSLKKNQATKPSEVPQNALSKTPSSENLIYKNNFYEGLRLRTIGDIEGSQKALEWCLSQRPEDDAVLYLLAVYAENTRRLSRAREYIKKASEIDPKNIWYVELLARIQIQSDDFVGAESSYKKLLDYDRYNKEWLYYYSETLIFNRRFEEAISILSRLMEEVGPVPELVKQRNDLYLDLKKESEFLIEMKKLIVEYPEMPEFTSMLLGYYKSKSLIDIAEKELLSIAKENTNHAGAHIALADLYNFQGNSNKALDQLKLAFECNILNLDNSIQVLLAVIESKQENNPKALELAIILREKNPNHFMPHALLGEIYKQSGKKREGLLAFEKSLELKPDNYELWLEIVAINYGMKRYGESLKKAEKALDLFPSQPQLYYYAGMSALRENSLKSALDFFEIGKDYVVRDPVFKAQFELATAEVYLIENNIPRARQHIEAADYLASNEKLIQNNRAYLLAKYKIDLEKALDIIQTVILGNENESLYLDTYAWVRFARKEYSQALEIIQKAHKISPNNAEINEHYGDILFHLNKPEEALLYWIKAQELGDESLELRKKIQTKNATN